MLAKHRHSLLEIYSLYIVCQTLSAPSSWLNINMKGGDSRFHHYKSKLLNDVYFNWLAKLSTTAANLLLNIVPIPQATKFNIPLSPKIQLSRFFLLVQIIIIIIICRKIGHQHESSES